MFTDKNTEKWFLVLENVIEINVQAAQQLYVQQFPDIKHPEHRNITNAVCKLHETDNVSCLPSSGRPMQNDTDILACVFANSQCSLKEVNEESGLRVRESNKS